MSNHLLSFDKFSVEINAAFLIKQADDVESLLASRFEIKNIVLMPCFVFNLYVVLKTESSKLFKHLIGAAHPKNVGMSNIGVAFGHRLRDAHPSIAVDITAPKMTIKAKMVGCDAMILFSSRSDSHVIKHVAHSFRTHLNFADFIFRKRFFLFFDRYFMLALHKFFELAKMINVFDRETNRYLRTAVSFFGDVSIGKYKADPISRFLGDFVKNKLVNRQSSYTLTQRSLLDSVKSKNFSCSSLSNAKLCRDLNNSDALTIKSNYFFFVFNGNRSKHSEVLVNHFIVAKLRE